MNDESLPSISGEAEPAARDQIQRLQKLAKELHGAQRRRAKQRVFAPPKPRRQIVPVCRQTPAAKRQDGAEEPNAGDDSMVEREFRKPRKHTLPKGVTTALHSWLDEELDEAKELGQKAATTETVFANNRLSITVTEFSASTTADSFNAANTTAESFNASGSLVLATKHRSVSSPSGSSIRSGRGSMTSREASKQWPSRLQTPSLPGSLTARDYRHLRQHRGGLPAVVVSDAEALVAVYGARKKASESAVQESVERFTRMQKSQEPLLSDLKQMQKPFIGEKPASPPREKLNLRTSLAAGLTARREQLAAAYEQKSELFQEGPVEAEGTGSAEAPQNLVVPAAKGPGLQDASPRSSMSGSQSPRNSMRGSILSTSTFGMVSMASLMPGDEAALARGSFRSQRSSIVSTTSQKIAKFGKSAKVRGSDSQVLEMTPEEEEAHLHEKIEELTKKEKEQLKRWQQGVSAGQEVKDGRDWLKGSVRAETTSSPSSLTSSSASFFAQERPHQRSNRANRQMNELEEHSQFKNARQSVNMDTWTGFLRDSSPKRSWKELPRAACTMEAEAEQTLFIVPGAKTSKALVDPTEAVEKEGVQEEVTEQEKVKEEAKVACRLAKSCVKTTLKKPWEPLLGESDKVKKESSSASSAKAQKQGHGSEKSREEDASAIWARIRATAAFSALVGRV